MFKCVKIKSLLVKSIFLAIEFKLVITRIIKIKLNFFFQILKNSIKAIAIKTRKVFRGSFLIF